MWRVPLSQKGTSPPTGLGRWFWINFGLKPSSEDAVGWETFNFSLDQLKNAYHGTHESQKFGGGMAQKFSDGDVVYCTSTAIQNLSNYWEKNKSCRIKNKCK